MKKLPYEQLEVVVSKMYERDFPEGADKEIEEWCEEIADFIRRAGWDEQSYIEEFIRRGTTDITAN